jgi:hypothetical protein
MRKKQSFPVRFTPELEDAVRRTAEANGISRAEVVRLAVTQFLAQLGEAGRLVVEQVVRAPADKADAAAPAAPEKRGRARRA